MQDKIEKIGITALLSALFAWCGMLAVPFLLLVVLQVVDYATGLFAAKYRSEKISSYKSIRGIGKKVCMWLLVVVGGVMDWVIAYAANNAGVPVATSYIVAIVVCVWIMCNEIISILENISDIGVVLPPFLLPLIRRIKGEVEKHSEEPLQDNNKEDDDNGKD